MYGAFALQVIIAMLLWQFSTHTMFPQPTEVFSKLLSLLMSEDFWRNLFQSMSLTLQAMFYSIIIACLLGYASTLPVFTTFVHFITKLRYLTLTGLVFSFTVIFKDGDSVAIMLLMFGIIPFFALSLLSGIDSIEQKEFDICKTIGLNKWQTLWEIVIAGRLDQTIETIRANFAIAWLMITMVETYNMSKGGVGVMLYIFNKYNQLESIFATQLLIFVVGLSFDFLLQKSREVFFPYTKLTKKR